MIDFSHFISEKANKVHSKLLIKPIFLPRLVLERAWAFVSHRLEFQFRFHHLLKKLLLYYLSSEFKFPCLESGNVNN